ncbi:hypothetical protein [Aeromonas veronii]|uniref:hypothetical protein n=1 Tax=Aeromonas veronii TaxID=654 RepID=UPI0031FD4BF7
MKILNEIFAMIESYPQTGSSGVLAAAMASACNAHYAVSLLDVSVKLDYNGRRLVDRLARITQESDYSNAAQDQALQRLRVLGFIN